MDRSKWDRRMCPKINCRNNSCRCGLRYVSIAASLGDDSKGSKVAPKNGEYCNAIVRYEANDHVYIYSKEGIPVLVEEPCEGCEPTPTPEPTPAPKHLVINNLDDATWTPGGEEGEQPGEAAYDRGSVMSQDIEFKTDDGEILSVEDLYTALAAGEKFTIDVPFGDIAGLASVWDRNINMGTAKNVAFSTQENVTIDPSDESEIPFFLSSAAVMPIDHGGIVPYALPFGVGKFHDDYMFVVTVLGYNYN